MSFRKNEKRSEPEQMMTIGDLQSHMKCSKNFAYALANQPDFPSIRINSKIFIPVSKFNEWVDNYTGKYYNISNP